MPADIGADTAVAIYTPGSIGCAEFADPMRVAEQATEIQRDADAPAHTVRRG